MRFLTQDSVLLCKHKLGKVGILASQDWVTIGKRKILVEIDPEGKAITGCPNVGAAIKPCTLTLKVKKGYSGFIRINGRRVCLDTITGLTDGTPPGVVEYYVHSPGQNFVEEV